MPWRQGTESDFFVDDPTSPDYNRWVRLARLLEIGGANAPRGFSAGTSFFLHVWRGPDSTTAGCTAMARTDLLTLLSWLDPAKAPVLVQAPVDDWPKLRLSLKPPNP